MHETQNRILVFWISCSRNTDSTHFVCTFIRMRRVTMSIKNYPLRFFDSAPSHIIHSHGLKACITAGIRPICLAPSTTSYHQTLDCLGFFRSIKASLRRSDDFGVGIEGMRPADVDIHCASPTFWSVYRNYVKQYSVVEQFARLGFSLRYKAQRDQKIWMKVDDPEIFSKLRKLKDQSSVKEDIEDNVYVENNIEDSEHVEIEWSKIELTKRQKQIAVQSVRESSDVVSRKGILVSV